MSRWLVLVLLLSACGASRSYVWASQLPPAANVATILRPGDKIQVAVDAQPTFSGEFEIRPGGDVILPGAGQVTAAGRTPQDLATLVAWGLKGMLEKPRVTITLASRHLAAVSVVGEVRAPGRFEAHEGDGVLDVLARAGGLTPFADEDRIYLIRRDHRTPRVRFRYRDLTAADPRSIGILIQDGDILVVE